jgi:hypothetical protein
MQKVCTFDLSNSRKAYNFHKEKFNNMTTTTKMTRVENTDKQSRKKGIVAFQMVKFEYYFFGNKQVDFLDTKIMSNGDQIVIDGNGFIKAGTKI